MNVPTRLARNLLAIAAFASSVAPLAAQAQSADAQPQAGSYPLWSLQYDVKNFTAISAAPGTSGAVTCTDGTIMGNVGSTGGRPAVVQTRCPISGNVVTPISATVIAQFNAQFDKLGKRICQTQLAGTLAGVTLAPGVYCFPAAASLTGTVTLDGPATGVWIIQVNGDVTAKSFSMVMANGAKPCNTYIESTGAATMTSSDTKANLYTAASITLTGGTFVGRAFAKQAVTMTGVATTGCQ